MTIVAQQKINSLLKLVDLAQEFPLKPLIRKGWSELMIALLNDLEREIVDWV